VGLTYVCLSATLSVRFLWEPQLKVGTFVTRDIRAPRAAETVDREATREAKERARQEVPQVYRVDHTARVRASSAPGRIVDRWAIASASKLALHHM
jgi:membrane-associated HD superfamily phosphohydrolase